MELEAMISPRVAAVDAVQVVQVDDIAGADLHFSQVQLSTEIEAHVALGEYLFFPGWS